METNSENKVTTAESSNSIKHSKSNTKGAVKPAPVVNDDRDVEIALLKAENEALKKASQADSISDMANAFTKALTMAMPKAPVETPNFENINRTEDFRGTKTTVDGNSLKEAQQSLQGFRNEDKEGISIPKILIGVYGPSLDITVNGVRVSIPVDGKVHYVNRTHAEHARERMAKLDVVQTKPGDTVELS